MRRYYDPQGNPTGTSTSTAGKAFAGCLTLLFVVVAISVVVGVFSH